MTYIIYHISHIYIYIQKIEVAMSSRDVASKNHAYPAYPPVLLVPNQRATDVFKGVRFGNCPRVVLPRIFTIVRAHTENGTKDNEAQSGSPLGTSWR